MNYTCQLADSAMVGYAKDIKRLPCDPVQAKKLLKEAGINFTPRPDRWLVFKEISKK